MYFSTSLDIQYRPDLDFLTIRWLDELPSAHFQQEYQHILTEAQQHDTPRWLVDVRRRPTPTPDMAEWAATTWLPQVVATLAPRRPRLAYLISPSSAAAIQTNPTLKPSLQTAIRPDRGYDVAIFNSEGEATTWLLAS